MVYSWQNTVITKDPHSKTNFTSVTIDDPQDCYKYFGKYTDNQETILVVQSNNNWCCHPYVTVPYGVYCLMLTSEQVTGFGIPGFQWVGPFTDCKYMVSKQDFVYQSSKMSVLLKDNIYVTMSVSIVMNIVASDPSKLLQLCTNVGEINSVIDNHVDERVRILGRATLSKHAYNLRGDKHALAMKEAMQGRLQDKCINIKRVVISDVELDQNAAQTIQDTTMYQFKNTLERKKFAYNQRIKNDEEESQKAKQIKEEERKDESEQAQLRSLHAQKDIEAVRSKTARVLGEWKARTDAKIDAIDIETELRVSEIDADANLIETEIIEQATSNAEQMKAEATYFYVTEKAKAESEIAPLIAEAVMLEGEAQKLVQKAFIGKRQHDQALAKLTAVQGLAENKNAIYTGEQSGNLVAQIQYFNMLGKKLQ